MGRSIIPSALAELSNPTTPEAQVDALRNLKNEIVGHEQRKELAVTHGVIRPLAGLLKEGVRRGGKRRHSNGLTQQASNGSAPSSGHASSSQARQEQEAWTREDELRFQATLVVGSLANGELVTRPGRTRAVVIGNRMADVRYRWASFHRAIAGRTCPSSAARDIAPDRDANSTPHYDPHDA
jgi:hypothetical protein